LGQGRVAVAACFYSCKDDDSAREEVGGPVSGSDVEVAGAFGEDSMVCRPPYFYGGQMDEVGGGCEADCSLAPVHPVFFAVDRCGDEAVGRRRVDDAAGPWIQGIVFAVGRARKAGPCLVQCSRSGEVAIRWERWF